jgi:rRNA maturation protein Nop10
MKKNTPIYPIWICHPCGMRHGNKKCGVATWHENTCDICGVTAAVTEPRDFGHLKDAWIRANIQPLTTKEL